MKTKGEIFASVSTIALLITFKMTKSIKFKQFSEITLQVSSACK